jgi:hypothetical protein
MATHTVNCPSLSGANGIRVSLGLTLGAHERPVSCTFYGGRLGNSSHDLDEDFLPALCDSAGNSSQNLGTVRIGHATEIPSGWVSGSEKCDGCSASASSANAWNNLRGKALYLKKVRDTDTWANLYAQVKIDIVTSVHALTWSGANLTFSQNEYSLTITRAGSASDNWSGSVTYRLYMDGVDKGPFSGNSRVITLTDADLELAHSFMLVASGTADGDTVSADGTTKSFTPASVHKTVSYYDGTQWVECVPYYYDGSAWQEVYPYYYDGSGWQLCSRT